MVHHILSLTLAAAIAWFAWSLRQPGATSTARMLGLVAWIIAGALLDDGFDGILRATLLGGNAQIPVELLLGNT